MIDVRTMKLAELDSGRREELLQRRVWDKADVQDTCSAIINAVRSKGDAALLEYTKRFDGVDLSNVGLRVSAGEIERSPKMLADDLRAALLRSMANVRKLHEAQVPRAVEMVEVEPGLWCGDRWNAIDTVCLYVPRGRGSFASVAYMLGVPAKLAGAKRVVLCTPPGPDGKVDAGTLFVAKELGIEEVYRVGGAQAVAAVAWGTESIPKCDKIVGPGNVYITAARRMLSEVIDPGPIAGPSESLIIADGSANPINVAWNLLVEAEHGENSCALLLTHVKEEAERVGAAIQNLSGKLTEQRSAFAKEVLEERGGILITGSLEESIEFANDFAAEHVAIMTNDPWAVVSRVRHAGEILLGDYPIISLGNYSMGINAILPTGAWAKTASGISVLDFMKRTSIGCASASAYESLRSYVPVIAKDEGFSAHCLAVEQWQRS